MSLRENDVEFLFNSNKLIYNYDGYKRLGNIFYPLKTNSNDIIINNLKQLFNNDDGFLISNIRHFVLLTKLNISPNKMCLINVLSGNDTIKYLYNQGVRFFVFDNISVLNYFISYANLKECKIALRLNTMEVFEDTLMHLGASTNECIKMLELLKDKGNKVGISFYLQTKIKNDFNAMEKMINYIKQNFNSFKLDFISIAGIKKYSELNEKYIKKIKVSMNLSEIILEPGKYLVGNTFDMITKVIRLKNIKDKSIVIIKNGIYSGLLDVLLYNEKFQFYLKTINNDYIEFSHIKDNEHDYEIYMCGGSSDSGDIIGTMYINKKYRDEIKIGTEILIKDIGSYFEEFFMNYGGDINKVFMEVDE